MLNKKREIKLQLNNYQIRYGSLNKENTEVIYIRVKAKIHPLLKKNDYSEDISLLKKDFLKKIQDIVYSNSDIKRQYICHFDTNECGMTYNRNSFIKYDLYIKPKEAKHINEQKEIVTNIIGTINNDLNILLSKYNITFI